MNRIKLNVAAILMALGMVPASVMAAATTGTLNVSAGFIVAPAGIVVAGPLAFATAALIDGNAGSITASTSFNVTVSSGAPYTVVLDGGLVTAISPTQRFVSDGVHSLSYNLWQSNPASANPWDRTAPVAATGTGSAQTYTVFGVLNKPTLASWAGSYADTVTITVTY